MKSANAYGSPSSPAQIALCGEEPSSHGSGRSGRPGQDLGQPRERVLGRDRALEVGEQLGELLGEVVGHRARCGRAAARAWSSGRCRPRARCRGRSGAGYRPASTLNVSATLNGL